MLPLDLKEEFNSLFMTAQNSLINIPCTEQVTTIESSDFKTVDNSMFPKSPRKQSAATDKKQIFDLMKQARNENMDINHYLNQNIIPHMKKQQRINAEVDNIGMKLEELSNLKGLVLDHIYRTNMERDKDDHTEVMNYIEMYKADSRLQHKVAKQDLKVSKKRGKQLKSNHRSNRIEITKIEGMPFGKKHV